MTRMTICAFAVLGAMATARADEIRVGGAGAAAALVERLAEVYVESSPGDTFEHLRGLGSSGSIAAAMGGAIHLAFASRTLKPEERAHGVEARPFLETPFVFVTSHPKPQSIARADVAAIFDGRMRDWPDGREIKPILRPRSDTVSPWIADNMPGAGPALEQLRQRPEVPVAATDHDNLQMAEAVPGSFAASTLVQFMAERPRLKLVAFDDVTPCLAAMDSGDWPDIWRIWIVTPAEPTAAARRFIAWLDSPAAIAILRENGARPAPRRGAPQTH